MRTEEDDRKYLAECRERGIGSAETLIRAFARWYALRWWQKLLHPIRCARMRQEIQSAFVLYEMFEAEVS